MAASRSVILLKPQSVGVAIESTLAPSAVGVVRPLRRDAEQLGEDLDGVLLLSSSDVRV